MRVPIAISCLALSTTVIASGIAPPAHRSIPAGSDTGVFQYAFEKGPLGFDDIVRLRDGTQRTGKVMEWADQVLVIDGQGRVTPFDVREVSEFELRPAKRQLSCPPLPDLTVAYIERLPRDPSWHGHLVFEEGMPKTDQPADGVAWRPVAGAATTFVVHVLNAGTTKSAEVDCRILIDGQPIASGKVRSLDPGAEQVVEASWAWQDGPHVLRVEIDAAATQKEVNRWNNTFEEPTEALAVAVVVSRDRYEAFRKTPNMVDSFCFEDWLQYHIRCMNGLFVASIYPSSPKGILERVRCDRIMVVDDPNEPGKRAEWEAALRKQGRREGLCEESGVLVFDARSAGEIPMYGARKIDWPKLKDLGRELGLVDLKATDTRIEQCRVPDQGDRYAVRQHLFPWPRTLMHTPGGFPLSEICAGYLNAAAGKPRGVSGEYLFQVPGKISIEVRSNSGSNLAGVQVEAFQLQRDAIPGGVIIGTGRDPLYSATTGPDGRLELPNLQTPACRTPNGFELRPNPFGRIATDGSNGLLLLRLRHTHENVQREEFHFLRLFDCLAAYLHGQREEYLHPIQTRFPDEKAPLAPPFALIVMDDRSTAMPPMKLRWKNMSSLLDLEEFRVYKRLGLGGDDETPWTLASTVRKGGKRWNLESDASYFERPPGEAAYSPDTYWAITSVDKNGRESGLSNPTFAAFEKDCVKFAIDTEAAYITLSGPGPVQMLRWDGVAGQQPFLVNPGALPHYKPEFAGIAVTPEHRLIVSDPVNHVLALYDLNGNLEDTLPRRSSWPGFPSAEPGEFYDPADVAVDKQGRIYVADRGNSRVQSLDGSGHFTGVVDPDFQFNRPHAVACSNGRLCVTDNDGTRVRVYNIEGAAVKLERQLPAVTHVDRAVVSKAGKIYATGMDPVSKKTGILVFLPDGDSARLDVAVFEGEMGKVFDPRGAYLYDYLQDNYLYVVNKFPFDVRRIRMDEPATK